MKQVSILLFFCLVAKFSSALDEIGQGECILLNESRFSKNTCFELHFNDDGDLVVENFYTKKVTWSAGVGDRDANRACMQDDDNFVVYAANDRPLWSSETHRSHSSYRKRLVKVEDSGQLIVQTSYYTHFRFGEKDACVLSDQMMQVQNLSKEFEILNHEVKSMEIKLTTDDEKISQELQERKQQIKELKLQLPIKIEERKALEEEQQRDEAEIEQLKALKENLFEVSPLMKSKITKLAEKLAKSLKIQID